MATLADLKHDYDTIDLADGRKLRLTYKPDDSTSINDTDSYGAIARIYRHNHRERRPDGFDGRARKLRTSEGVYWWQPPADVADEHLDALRRAITDILEYGYNGISLEVLDGTDAYGEPIVTAYSDLYGIEPLIGADYLLDVLSDLLLDLPDDIRQQLHTDTEGI